MSSAFLWLAYLLSGAAAFALVYGRSWRLFTSMVGGTLVGLLLSMLVMLAFPSSEPNPYLQVELAMNGSLSLIFAGVGAAIALALRSRGGQ